MKTYKVIKVEWMDSVTCEGWRDNENLAKHDSTKCISCGIQIKTKRGSIGVTHSISGDDDSNSTIIIPRKTVRKLEVLSTFKM